MDRRAFLGSLAGAAGGTLLARDAAAEVAEEPVPVGDWERVRALFDLDPERIHLAGLFLASHPRPVREAIARYRAALDRDPVEAVFAFDTQERVRTVREAARYFGADPRAVALTDSTTMGLALLYHGMRLGFGDEILRTEHDHYATWYSLDLKAAACGATVRSVALHGGSAASVGAAELVERIVGAVGPSTRVLALTWVHSDTGLRLPIGAIARELQRRGLRENLLLCVDGVHGFGAVDADLPSLGCDFFVSGCHKWLHGPRGTGVVYAARPSLWERIEPVIPPFGVKHTEGLFRSPGGFHDFEHRWALSAAFAFHRALGRARVAARIEWLAGRARAGLASIPGVVLHTPLDPSLAAGIVAFDVEGMGAAQVVDRLARRHGIVASASPYGRRSVRVTPGIYNDEAEIDRFLDAVASMAPRRRRPR